MCSQGSMRMFAYHLCETPLVERTASAFEAHGVSVGAFGWWDCPVPGAVPVGGGTVGRTRPGHCDDDAPRR